MPVNGTIQNTIASNDRGFTYGDGVFETIRIHNHQPLLLPEHLARLLQGVKALKIPYDPALVDQELAMLAPDFPSSGVLKIVISRGRGGRGYRPDAASESSDTTRVLTLHPLPDYGNNKPMHGIAAFVCSQRLAIQPALAGVKHLNRLEQVLASLEWPEGDYMEGIMLDMDDHVVEGTRSNIFWAEAGGLKTPALDRCGVAGIMRNYLIEHMPISEVVPNCTLERLLAADEVFFCNSVFGIWPVSSVLTEGKSSLIGKEQQAKGQKGEFTSQAKSLFNELLTSHGT